MLPLLNLLHVGSGVESINNSFSWPDVVKGEQLNQALSVLVLAQVFECVCSLLGPVFVFCYFVFVCVLSLDCSG